jgi:molybdopterin-binding protein
VTAVERGDVMAQIAFVVPAESVIGSVIPVDPLDEWDLKVGDEVRSLVKAVHALPVKEA